MGNRTWQDLITFCDKRRVWAVLLGTIGLLLSGCTLGDVDADEIESTIGSVTTNASSVTSASPTTVPPDCPNGYEPAYIENVTSLDVGPGLEGLDGVDYVGEPRSDESEFVGCAETLTRFIDRASMQRWLPECGTTTTVGNLAGFLDCDLVEEMWDSYENGRECPPPRER